MKTTKKLGIWIDHSVAYLTEIEENTISSSTIEAQPKLQGDEEFVYKDESHTLNKEKKQLTSFYKEVSEMILGYEWVVLYGPGDAKNELFNLLKIDHLFDKIKIDVKPADKMTDVQRNIFVKEYFR